jgi:hypothetical protein
VDILLVVTFMATAVPLLVNWWLTGREIEERIRPRAPREAAAPFALDDLADEVVAAPSVRVVHLAVRDADERPGGRWDR